MKVELPNFVTKSFIQNVFKKQFSDESLTVESFWGEWATKKGDNYASEMYRIHVEYREENVISTKPILLKVKKIIKISKSKHKQIIRFYNSS